VLSQGKTPPFASAPTRQDWVVFRRLFILGSIYLAPVLLAFRRINDPDVWWHLRTGQWIVTHHMIPREDPFSLTGGPWIAYSWLFEVLLYGCYSALGLAGIVLLAATMSVAIILALHLLIQRARPPFWLELALLLPAVTTLLPVLIQPRSWLFTLLFALIELHVLAAYRDGAPARCLLILPPLLAIWANMHVQFVYGVGLLVFALTDAVIRRIIAPREKNDSRIVPLMMAGTAAVLATLINPYGIYVVQPVLDAIKMTDPFLYISELNALAFRVPGDWMVLALALATAFTLGWRRILVPLPLLVFLFGCAVGFRAQRDVWLLTVGASWLIACAFAGRDAEAFVLTRRRTIGLIGTIAVASVALASYGLSNTKLAASLRKTFPVAAVTAMEQHGSPGPVFNTYDWGGYLMWRLPHLKVSLDGRNTLHGDARVWRSIRTWSGREGWDSDPDLVNSSTVIAPRIAALTSLLRLDPRFSVVYEDELAVVFTRSQPALGR
jgi:hypothetical protein